MIIRPKDHIYWEVLFDTQEEAEAFKDYWEQVMLRGYHWWQSESVKIQTDDGTGNDDA